MTNPEVQVTIPRRRTADAIPQPTDNDKPYLCDGPGSAGVWMHLPGHKKVLDGKKFQN
jgi:hypothetical protein